VDERKAEDLRVLIANEPSHAPALVRTLVETLGHHVIAPRLGEDDLARVVARSRPDVTLVAIGDDAGYALALIEQVVLEAACPVIALLDSPDPDQLREASRRGAFGTITDRDVGTWQSAIDIAWRRFDDFRKLEAAFGRRAVIERAKGILMERHAIDESTAFGLLRRHSRTTNRRLIEVAGAVADGHALLSGGQGLGTESRRAPPRTVGAPIERRPSSLRSRSPKSRNR
jgi:AmiR/NasT family two-component response regulator